MRQSFQQEPGNFNSLKRFALVSAFAITSIYSVSAQLEITGPDAAVIDFTDFTGAGFSPTPSAGQLDSDTWSVTGLSDGAVAFGGTGDTGDFARGVDGDGVTTGGIYSFTSPDINGGTGSLGVQAIGSDFTPGDMILHISNQTGGTITALSVSYEIWTLNDQDRSNSFDFSHSPDNLPSSYISVPELSYTSPEVGDASPSWQMTSQTTTISLSLSSGGDYYLRWTGDDVGGSGSRDEFALDNISVQAVPEPSTIAMLISGALMVLFYARRKRAI